MVPVSIKKVLYRLFGPKRYVYFQYLGKVRDIKHRTVWEKELHLLPMIIQKGDSVIDVGANFAVYCYHLSKAVGEKGIVHAFEPIPFTYTVCAKLLSRFRLHNVHLYAKGCGNQNGVVEFETPLQSFGAISAGTAHLGGRNNTLEGRERHYRFTQAATVECPVVRLDDFLTGIGKISFIKLDIEGAEYFALQGARKMLARDHPIIQCEINPFFLKGFNIDLTEFLGFMTGLGYRLYFYEYENGHHRFTEKWLKDITENNYLFIHPDRLARLETFIANP